MTPANFHLSTCRGGAASLLAHFKPGLRPTLPAGWWYILDVSRGVSYGATAAALFVLIVQGVGAQSGFVCDLHPCALASTLDRKGNELIRSMQLY